MYECRYLILSTDNYTQREMRAQLAQVSEKAPWQQGAPQAEIPPTPAPAAIGGKVLGALRPLADEVPAASWKRPLSQGPPANALETISEGQGDRGPCERPYPDSARGLRASWGRNQAVPDSGDDLRRLLG